MRGLKWLSAVIVGAVGLVSSIAPALAEGLFGISEIRGGPAISGGELIPGTYVIPQINSFSFSNLESAQFDLYFESPFPDVSQHPQLLQYLWSPRPFVGGILSLGGRESSIHAGLSWQIPVGDIVYLEFAGGGGFHNGALSGVTPPLRNLGCQFLFHWSAGVGANVTDNVTVTAQLQHKSNIVAGCTPNDGMNHFGVSVGWKF